MENIKVIKLDTNTKIMYSLFNFFAPISISCILLCSLGITNLKATIISVLSIFIGVFCSIFKLIKYNQFLQLREKTITICKGKISQLQVTEIIKIDDISPKGLNGKLSIEYKNKKTKLLETSFSILGLICYVGPLVCILLFKQFNVSLHKLAEIYNIYPELFTRTPRKPSMAEDIIINIITWGLVLFVVAVGCIGILLTPFYPFMG